MKKRKVEEIVLEETKIKARIKFFNLIKIHKFRHEIRQCNLVLLGGRGFIF